VGDVDFDDDGLAVDPDERCTADRCEHGDLRRPGGSEGEAGGPVRGPDFGDRAD
jgi:hypothetical protein